MEMKVQFPGGKKVTAEYNGFVHRTDQPVPAGGEGSAPSPFELFLASLGTCAGIYVLGFCQQRGIDTEGIEIVQRMKPDPVTRRIGGIELEIKLPAGFPDKYRDAVVSTANLCAVKKHIENPPEFKVFSSKADQ